MTVWNIDAAHTNVGFSVKHMMVSKVRGNFSQLEGTIDGNPEDLSSAKIAFKVDIASIDTSNEDRDNHLRSADFFNADEFPHMTFVSTKIVQTDDDEYEVTGNLTIKDVTKEVTFEAEYEGKGTNPWGQEVVGFSVEGKINRKDFGLTWNQALETGGVLVGESIKITIDLEANPA